MTTAAVVLAAGGGARYRDSGGTTHKLLAPFRGSTVVAVAVAAALEAGLDATFVVTGAVDLADRLPPAATVVANPAWADGQAGSVRAGVDAAAAAGHDAVVIGLGDQPMVGVEAWRLVAAAVATPIAVAVYDGVRANPVRIAAEVWPLLPATGDAGARAVIARHPALVTGVRCPGNPADLDTVEDHHRWS